MKTNKTKAALVALTLVTMLSGMVGFGNVPKAEAALSAVGPVLDPVNNGFPQFFSDENGLSLQLCLDQDPRGLCILTPGFDPATPPVTPIGTVASGIFPDESFYFIADAIIDPGTRIPGANTDIRIVYRAALEQAFLSGIAPNTQNIFLRVQADVNGLVPNSTYTITHPYGTMTVDTDATGGGRTRFEDMGVCALGIGCNFAFPLATNPVLQALTTNVGAFLQWDPAVLPAAPAGFIGDPNISHTVIGGRGGVNSVTITGPNVDGLGGTTLSTNVFAVAGKLADTIPPVITLNGANPMNVVAGTAYVEPGATAFDAFDAATTTTTVASSTVPAGNLVLNTGPFTVTYRAVDLAGNVASSTRTVNVVPDTTAPVITINGSSTVNILVGNAYTDAGATALDNVDGALTVVTTSTVNTAVAGAYTVTYTATDSSNNVATAVRTVNVAQDITGPVITINGANPATVSFGAVYTDLGATALDDFDGARTVTVTGLPFDSRTAISPVTITYTASDLSGNISTSTRIVNIVPDTTAPVITLNGANPMTIDLASTFTDPGATATDDVDGVRPVVATSTVNTAANGAYTVTYTASDTSGNVATVVRTVNVATDGTAPVITILGANPATVLVGTAYVDAGVTVADAIDGVIPTSSVVVTGLPVNTATSGTFTITYSVADAAGNRATSTRTVNVTTDATAPVITLNGANPMELKVGDTFTDPGATALDAISGTTTVSASSTVNTAAAGSYTVTYTARDAAGNVATAIRNVNVTNAPTFVVVTGGGGGGGGFGGSGTFSQPNFAPGTSGTGSSVGSGTGSSQGQVAGIQRFRFTRNLNQGMRGDDVRELQERLRAEGVFFGPSTGFFGPLTANAVKEFQKRHGLDDDGLVGSLTRGKLNEGTVLGASTLSAEARAAIQTQLVVLLQKVQELLKQLNELKAKGLTSM